MNTFKTGDQYNRIGIDYIASQEEFFREDDWSRKLVLARIGEISNKNVVDAGCGHGVETRLLLQGKPKSVIAFDPSDVMIDEAKRRVVSDSVTFSVSDFTSIPTENNSVDVLVSCFSLHYMDDIDVAYREVHRVLKKGGRAIFVVPHPLDSQSRCSSGVVSVKLYDDVVVTYPAHNREDYFSPYIIDNFDISELEEKTIPEVSTTIPAVMAYTLTKKIV